ncbi:MULTISPECIES: YdaS family helix-turn-helix protein [unclassified Caballeronia]|uniref:transcriptional regulator n=1 Tax=unclassified Caballeronia TaxID=2646786 RepID=UPI0028656A5E|nr:MULTISPECIES: YdaS family helix-turn-helix protein [unclassified Caballeronia]MDR5777597.1 YdaS family helix-turn-helix protein [Caballeronia sp. LZ002]MDR5802353.1 YdaS family helix-turn-helix protein [Caballeronia sp. LZ001]MDR5853029.1 YdaS family helix-turn-helix protein [Caballeronia sp. LZ003]
MDLDAFLSCSRSPKAKHFAEMLGVPSTLISQWRNRTREIPIKRCVVIERATGGLVSRRDLRPHDCEEIWPELSDCPGQDRTYESRINNV